MSKNILLLFIVMVSTSVIGQTKHNKKIIIMDKTNYNKLTKEEEHIILWINKRVYNNRYFLKISN